MCYKVPKAQEMETARSKLGTFSDKMFAVVGGEDRNIPIASRMLPVSFQATDGTLRVLRTNPVVVDTVKFPTNNEHNRLYAELLLFRSWFNEHEELGMASGDYATCRMIHATWLDHINTVKDGCRNFFLEHL